MPTSVLSPPPSPRSGEEPAKSNLRLLKRFFVVLVQECVQEPANDFTESFSLGFILHTNAHTRLCWTLQFDLGKLVVVQNGENPNSVSWLEVSESTVMRLLTKELSPIKAFLQRLVNITGDKEAWRRIPLAAVKRSGMQLLPLLEHSLPFPSYSEVKFIQREGLGWMPNLPRCQLCGDGFALLGKWKHHCRVCGKCVCATCSPHSLVGHRVCLFCYQSVATGFNPASSSSSSSLTGQKKTGSKGVDEEPPKTLLERMERKLLRPEPTAEAMEEGRFAALNTQVRANLRQIRLLKQQLQTQSTASSQESMIPPLSAWCVAAMLMLAVHYSPSSGFALYVVVSQLPQRPKLIPFALVVLWLNGGWKDFTKLQLLAMGLGMAHLTIRFTVFARLLDIYSTCLQIIFLYQTFKLFADRFITNEHTRDALFSKLHTLVAPLALQRVLELKSVFVKFGQYLGARSDIMPKEWTVLLERLQDDMPSSDLGLKSPYIAKLVGKMGKQLIEFDSKPVASASIAQVHQGVWLGGEKVAIKIQHEGCASLMKRDMGAFKRIVQWICYLNPQFDMTMQLLVAWEKEMLKELDFTQEVANLKEIAASLQETFPSCRLPQVVYSDDLCFVMKWIDGFKITDMEQLVGVNREQVVNTLVAIYAHQVFVKGFFQADPHAGNLFIDSQTNQLVLLDFGMCVRLTEKERLAYCHLLYALGNLSVSALSQAMQELGYQNTKSEQFPEQDLEFFAFLLRDTSATREESREVDGQFRAMRSKQQQENADRAGRRFQAFPESLLFIMRTFGLLRGLSTSLGTSVSYMEHMLEFAKYGLVVANHQPTVEATTTTVATHNALERYIVEALAGVEGGVQVACIEHGAVLADVAVGTVSDCNPDLVLSSTLFPLLELTKVLETVSVLRVLKRDDVQLLGPTIPSPPLYETLNHAQNGMEDCIHPSSFGHVLRNKDDELLTKVQTQAAGGGASKPSPSVSSRHTLSFGYELDLALKYNTHPKTSLREIMAGFNNAELNYATPARPKQHFADVSHGYVKDIQEMMLFANGGGGGSTASAPLSLTNLPVLPGRIVPDAMMVNWFRRDNIHVPSIGAFGSARAVCRFVYDAMIKDVDFIKRVDKHHSNETDGGVWGLGFKIHRRDVSGGTVFTHSSFGGSFFLCAPDKRLCLCVLVSHLQLDTSQTQRVVDLVCERLSISSVPV
ncbi:hypothetical protein BASA81_008591 [Batrachochytrium salamandrivorans]|nr:hypothetical protein BASA81_008591 [Batrachochytrium salamandrivorans]